MKGIQAKHGPHSIASSAPARFRPKKWPSSAASPSSGGDAVRRQHAAVHGHSVVAYKQSFGFDAPPYTYQDFEESDVIVLVGSNLCIAHPIMWQRICRNPHEPQIIVVDPRTTETAMAATLHLPLRPKSDLALLYGLAHILVREGWIDREFLNAHTTGFEEFAAHVQPFTPSMFRDEWPRRCSF